MGPGDLQPVILVGGLGTRLRKVLEDVPKPMAPVAGRPFIEWVLRYLRSQGWKRASLSTGFRAEVFDHYFASQPVPDFQVTLVPEPQPQGTAGGFLHAARQTLRELNQPPAGWLVMNGDSLLLVELAILAESWQNQNTPAGLLARHVENANRFGSLTIDSNAHLLHFAEKVPQASPQPGWINGGIYFLRQDLLDQFPLYRPGQTALSFEYDVFPGWLQEGKSITAVKCSGPFLDIGTEETLAQAEAFLESNQEFFP